MKIIISGAAKAYDRETEKPIFDAQRLFQLNGLAYDRYAIGEFLDESLLEIGIIGGEIVLTYTEAEPTLQVVATFHAPRELKKGELQQLIDETTAQWSDGIGEGEFQYAEELGIDVDISPFDSNAIKFEQVDDGVFVAEPKTSELVKILRSKPVDEKAALTLVNNGAAIDAKDCYGQSVLELACCAVLPELVEDLLKRGALNHVEDPNRMLSTLSYCQGSNDLLERSVQIAQLLVEGGVNVDAVNHHGETPLMMAACRNNLPLVRFLLDKGANVNAQRADELNQRSVLMYAHNVEMVQYLLERGADPNIRTAFGENAYEVQLSNSHQKNYMEIAELIKKYLN